VLDSSLQQSIHSLQPHARSDRIEGPNSWDLGQPLPLLKYVHTFSENVPEDILQCLGDTMQQKSGGFWAIPSDGLVELALSARVLRITYARPASEREAFIESELRKEIERKLDSLCVFDKALSEMLGCGFFVFDFDPFTEGALRYQLGKSQSFNGSHDMFAWDVEWEDQNIRPMWYPDANPIFMPVTLHGSMRHYAVPEWFAPWRRLM